jgi:hypothetical protein
VRRGTYDVSCVSLNGEDDGRAHDGANNRANGPEQRQAMQHLAERLASLVAQIQALAELRAT